jgi:hypothetical protein
MLADWPRPDSVLRVRPRPPCDDAVSLGLVYEDASGRPVCDWHGSSMFR